MATISAGSSSAEAEALKLAFEYLVNSMDTSSLLPAALSRGLIREQQKADCTSESNPYQKAEKFLEHLQREVYGDNGKFHTFVQLLEDTGHSNLVSRLLDELSNVTRSMQTVATTNTKEGEPPEEHIIVVSDLLLKELTSLKVSYARFLRQYKREIKNSSEVQEEFIEIAKTILGRGSSSSDFQSCFDTLVEKEVSLFNITYLREICNKFPEDVSATTKQLVEKYEEQYQHFEASTTLNQFKDMFPVSATPSKLSTGKINITLKLKNYWGDNTLDDLKKLIGLFDIPSCCIHLKRIGVGSVLVLLLCSTTVAKELKGAIDKAADLLKTKGVLQVFVEEEILLEFPQPYQAAAARPPPPKNSDSLRSSESHGNPRHVHHATDAYNNERPIWIYVDDSNIWITAKKLAAKRMKTKEDHRIRIDIGRLTDVVAKGRVVAHGFLYGFEPPPVDTVWEKIKERGWDVPKPKRRSAITGKEKGVDAQLVADITELACTTPEEERTTIIIISGDADVMPAIHKLLKYRGWSVEVCMWEDAMSNDLKKLPQREPKVVVNYLDKFLEHITFTNMKFNPRHLHSCEKATAVVFQMKPKAFPDRVPSNKWCRVLQSITQWPFQYYWAELNGRETNDLVLVFRDDGKHSFDLNSFMAQIKEYPIQRTLGAQTYVQYDQEKSGLYRMELDKVGQIHYDEACDEGYESEASAILDSDDDAYDKLWQIKRRLPPPRKTPLYSELCPFRINCKFGLKCLNKHTEDEKRFFRTNQGEGNPLRKVKPCLFHPNCKKEMKECHYAHGEEDAWCLSCRDMCGHYTQNCPQLKKSQNDD